MENIIIQNITQDNICEYEKLCALSFHFKLEGLADKDSYIRQLRETEDKKLHKKTWLYGNHLVRPGLYSEGKLQAAMSIFPYVVRFDGKECEMGGVGGVVSNPEIRRSGNIRRLYKQVFEDMRNRGQILSQLYPFKASFYRKFGYEYCAGRGEWSVPTEYLPDIAFSGMVHYENTEEQNEDIKKVYAKFAERLNLSVIRSDEDWQEFLSMHKPYETETYSFLHYHDEEADGFLSYTVQQYPTEAMTIKTDNLYYANGNALREMLAFLKGYSVYTSRTKLLLPADTDITLLLDEMCGKYGFHNVQREVIACGMARVVDVPAILQLATYRGMGSASIRIHDSLCPWNDRCFQLVFDKELIQISEGTEADIELDINTFSAVILGRYSFEDFGFLPNIKVYGNEDNLRKIFYKKDIWIEEGF